MPVARLRRPGEQRLAPFNRKATTELRRIAPRQQVYVEPFVLFNFGQAETTLPGGDTGNVLSFHSYAVDAAGKEGVVRNALAAATRDGAPLMTTEFGLTTDDVLLDVRFHQFDGGVISWMFWHYGERIIAPGVPSPRSATSLRHCTTCPPAAADSSRMPMATAGSRTAGPRRAARG